ncbi:hypothetical protein HRbin39_00890 [bacterium HR39]|nr:hypothetical protein HRbin39_00890 [bacterium HR39]
MDGLCWLDQELPFRRRSGRVDLLTPLAITDAHEDDPVVAVETGHPVTDLGFRFLLRDLLQIALAPPDEEAWAELWFAPPEPERLAAAFAPYRRALVLDDPAFPAMQVRPEADDGSGEPLPLGLLLPDAPSNNELKNQRAFFAHAPAVDAVGAGVVLPLFYADMVLFPSAGGGYFGVPTGAQSVKFAVGAGSLWRSLWANVLSGDDPFWPKGTTFPAPCDGAVFPWLDPTLRRLALGRGPAGTREVKAEDRHPAAIPMPRRYLLEPPTEGRCSLTGVEGPVFRTYRRWPVGLRYDPEGFRTVWAAERETWTRSGKEWTQSSSEVVKVETPLRFDDWLEAAFWSERSPPSAETTARTWKRVIPAPVVRRAAERVEKLEAELLVEAAALVLEGKVPAASAERRQPLYARRLQEELQLAERVHRLVAALGEMGDALARAGKAAGAEGELPERLRDALLTAMDAAAVAYPARVVEAWRAHPEEADFDLAVGRIETEILEAARRRAVELFDEAFPLVTLDGETRRVLAARRALVRALRSIVDRFAVREEEG